MKARLRTLCGCTREVDLLYGGATVDVRVEWGQRLFRLAGSDEDGTPLYVEARTGEAPGETARREPPPVYEPPAVAAAAGCEVRPSDDHAEHLRRDGPGVVCDACGAQRLQKVVRSGDALYCPDCAVVRVAGEARAERVWCVFHCFDPCDCPPSCKCTPESLRPLRRAPCVCGAETARTPHAHYCPRRTA